MATEPVNLSRTNVEMVMQSYGLLEEARPLLMVMRKIEGLSEEIRKAEPNELITAEVALTDVHSLIWAHLMAIKSG